jgi:DNA-binding response OmpR family regulator
VNKILIVEDEPGIAFALESDLQAEGYETAVIGNGTEAVQRGSSEEFQLILLDVMLPGKDGFDVCRDLRRVGVKTPIILLTAKTHEAEKIVGLDVGADDYVTKPYSPRELRARIRAAIRRGAPPETERIYRFGPCELDFARHELRRNGQRVDATPTEIKMLAVLVRNRGRVLTRERLLDDVRGADVFVSNRVIDNFVVSLRRKIEDDPGRPRYIISVRGMGYRFDD